MNMHDRQHELGPILAQIAMIAEEVNVLALEGSGADTTHDEQLARVGEVKLRVGEIMRLCLLMAVLMDASGN
jgi:hypothetical protein